MFKIGTRLRGFDGILYHVRGMVDGRYVLRSWHPENVSKCKWRYVVLSRRVVDLNFGEETRGRKKREK